MEFTGWYFLNLDEDDMIVCPEDKRRRGNEDMQVNDDGGYLSRKKQFIYARA